MSKAKFVKSTEIKSTKKTIKAQDLRYNVSAYYSKNAKPFSAKDIAKIQKTTIQSMVRSGKFGGEQIKQFINTSNKAIRAVNAQKLTKTGQKNVRDLMNYGTTVLKGDSEELKFERTKHTKATKYVQNAQTIDTKLAKQLYKKGYITKTDLKTINYRNQQAKKPKKPPILKIYEESDVKAIIDSMGGLPRAIKKYPNDVRRLFNDYLGVDAEELIAQADNMEEY